MVSKRSQVGIKIDEKLVLGDLKSVLGCPCGGLGTLLVAKTENLRGESVFWKLLGAILAGSWGHLGVLLASKREPRTSKKRSKNQSFFFVACWERFLDRFWSVLGSKAGPSWLQNRYRIDVNIEKRFFKKLRFSAGKTMIFMVRGVQVGRQKPRQDRTGQDRTEQVKTGQDGRGFWWIFEAKLRRKNAIHPSKVTHGDARRGM